MIRCLLFLVPLIALGQMTETDKVLTRQGSVAFFSYTPVENIKAENKQVLSIVELSSGNIAVSMLMNAFVFEKALMREHFNESYVESDLYPKATFEGEILDFDRLTTTEQTRVVKGTFTMHGVSQELEIKTRISYQADYLVLTGTFEAVVDDYEIRIPPLLAGNIAKSVSVDFRFEYEPYEE